MMLEPWARALPPTFYLLIREGYLAVGMFFILSGFVLSRSYGETAWRRTNIKRYFWARVARVYPVYLLSLLILFPFIAGANIPGKSWLIVDYLMLLQGWTGNLPVHWNTPAWSLSCEIFFYLTFPLFAIAIEKTTNRALVYVAALVCLLPAILRFAEMSDSIKPLVHLADFAIGMIASRAYDFLNRPERSLRGRGYWLYLPALALGCLLLARPFIIPGVLDLNGMLRPLVATALIGLSLGGGVLFRLFSSRIAVYLGKTSYAIYILHIPLLWTFKRWWPFWFPTMSDTVAAFCYVSIVIAVSGAVYSLIEEPANHYLRKWPTRQKEIAKVEFSADALASF